VAGIGLTLLLASGCDNPEGGAVAGPGSTGTSAAPPPAVVYPLDAYRQRPDDRETIRSAGYAVFARCMSRFGLAVPMPSSPGRGSRPVAPERFGLTDERHAARFGYHPAPASVVKPTPPALSAAAEAVAEGTGTGYHGGRPVPRGGCSAEARRVLNHGTTAPPDPALADRLDLEAHRAMRIDGKALRVFGEWRGCMRRAGHTYADPFAANNDPRFRTARPSRREIAVAVADVRCKRAVNLVPVLTAVEAEHQERLVAANRSALAGIRAVNQVVARNAARELAADAGRAAAPLDAGSPAGR
jgi:hypothetical protein